MSSTAEAQEVLARISASRAQLARAAHCPPSRDLVFAALMLGIATAGSIQWQRPFARELEGSL